MYSLVFDLYSLVFNSYFLVLNLYSLVFDLYSLLQMAQVLKFVNDLRTKRSMDVAKATGGANMLNPEKYGPSGVPLSEDSVVEDQQRENELAKIDAEKLHRYVV